MDESQESLNKEIGEEANPSEATAEEKKATGEVKETEPTGEESQTETGEAPKKGAQSRIRELSHEVKEERARAESLAQKLAALTGSVEPTQNVQYQPPQQPLPPLVAPGEEDTITVAELERRQQQREQQLLRQTQAMIDLKDKQREAINRVNLEAEKAMVQYPQLDPASDQFDEELNNSIIEATEAYVTANPYTASPLKFVSKLMKPYMRSVIKEVSKEREVIAKQASQTALRPTSVTSKEKSDDELTPTELEKKYGIIYS